MRKKLQNGFICSAMEKLKLNKNKGLTLYYEKEKRAYEIRLDLDLFGYWLVIRLYGSKLSPLGHQITEAFDSWEEGYERLQELHHYRIKKRKYKLMSR